MFRGSRTRLHSCFWRCFCTCCCCCCSVLNHAPMRVYVYTYVCVFVTPSIRDWWLAQLGLSALLSAVFTRHRYAVSFGFLVVVATAIINSVLTQVITSSHWPSLVLLFPPLAYCRAMVCAVRRGVKHSSSSLVAKTV